VIQTTLSTATNDMTHWKVVHAARLTYNFSFVQPLRFLRWRLVWARLRNLPSLKEVWNVFLCLWSWSVTCRPASACTCDRAEQPAMQDQIGNFQTLKPISWSVTCRPASACTCDRAEQPAMQVTVGTFQPLKPIGCNIGSFPSRKENATLQELLQCMSWLVTVTDTTAHSVNCPTHGHPSTDAGAQ
jgi:hypothetical protein